MVCYNLKALGKPRKMGCVDSQPDFVAQDCGGEVAFCI